MSEMEIEISYNIVSDERYEEIVKNCSRIMMELFIDSLKNEKGNFKE